MQTTIEQQVRAAKTPRDALLILARAVDQLTSGAPDLDSWSGWGPGDQSAPGESRSVEGVVDSPAPVARKVSNEEVYAWFVRNFNRAPEDTPEGRAALDQIRHDIENAPNEPQRAYEFVQTADGVIESTIDWRPLNDKHREARYTFAQKVLNLDLALGKHPEPDGDWAADYAEGGPFWFYIPNRDLVMQYPEQVRSQMVADVALYGNQKVVDELAQDLLKRPMSTDIDGRGAPRPAGFEPEQLQ